MAVVRFIRRQPNEEVQGERPGESAAELLVPKELLQRHGGRVLDPDRAFDRTTPRPAVYRQDVLLIPADILRDATLVRAIRQVLAAEGLALVLPPSGTGETPRPVTLQPADGCHPAQVDSWLALQYLRIASTGDDPVLSAAVVRRIAVEPLMFSAVIMGAPWETGGGSVSDSYRRSASGTSRIPVTMSVEPPDRGEPGATTFARRPVIAVLDSGIGPHTWFGIHDRVSPLPLNGFISVLAEAQQAIRDNAGLLDYWDEPVVSDALVRDVDTNTGHGTFIAGIIRQMAPRADVLAIRVMHSDGIAYGSDVVAALDEIYRRVRRAQRLNRPEEMVDVVSLSLGYLDDSPAAAAYTTHLAASIARLIERGVLILAAAGNNSTRRRFYPAAFAELPAPEGGGPQVIGVGALNPNNTKALFSNDGKWVTCWATGAGVVSMFPADVSGPRQPDYVDQKRSGLDPDDFSSGFAVWDGTSFATPMAAATVANALIDVAASDTGFSLANVDQATVVKRAWAALERCYERDEV